MFDSVFLLYTLVVVVGRYVDPRLGYVLPW